MLQGFRSIIRRIGQFVKSVKLHPQDPGFQDGSKIFFITGRPRSGTTWMANLLNSHPSLFCYAKENRAFDLDFEFRHFVNYPHLLLERSKKEYDDRIYKLLKNGLITNLICQCDKLSAQKLGDKSPRQDILRILELFPKAQIIIMLRDFRDVCISVAYSLYRKTGTWKGYFADPGMQAIDTKFLRDYLGRFENLGDFVGYSQLACEIPEQVIIIRYEDMQHKPEVTLKQIFEFLRVDSKDRLVSKCVQANTFEKLSGGRQPGEANYNSFFRKGIVGDWRNHFDAENITIFKEIAGNTLIAAGYEHDNQWGI